MRHSAIRLKHLTNGTVQFETVTETNILGYVFECANGNEPGLLGYQENNDEKTIIYFNKDCNSKNYPKLNDKVRIRT